MYSLRQETSLHFSLKKRQTEALQLEGTGCFVTSAGPGAPIGRKLQLKMTLKKLQMERAFCLAVSVREKPGHFLAFCSLRFSVTFRQRSHPLRGRAEATTRPDRKQMILREPPKKKKSVHMCLCELYISAFPYLVPHIPTWPLPIFCSNYFNSCIILAFWQASFFFFLHNPKSLVWTLVQPLLLPCHELINPQTLVFLGV